MTTRPDNPFTRAARLEKAAKLADRLQRDGVTAAKAEQAPAVWWTLAASQAGVNPPSAQTIELVLDTLRRREPVRSRRQPKTRVQCAECGKRWLTASSLPTCSRCNSADVEPADVRGAA